MKRPLGLAYALVAVASVLSATVQSDVSTSASPGSVRGIDPLAHAVQAAAPLSGPSPGRPALPGGSGMPIDLPR